MPCIFCEIVQLTRPADVVWASELVVAFRPLGRTRSRVLIVPAVHIRLVADAPPTLLSAWTGSWPIVAEVLGARSYRVHVNQGSPYQSVFHLHAHLLLPGLQP